MCVRPALLVSEYVEQGLPLVGVEVDVDVHVGREVSLLHVLV